MLACCRFRGAAAKFTHFSYSRYKTSSSPAHPQFHAQSHAHSFLSKYSRKKIMVLDDLENVIVKILLALILYNKLLRFTWVDGVIYQKFRIFNLVLLLFLIFFNGLASRVCPVFQNSPYLLVFPTIDDVSLCLRLKMLPNVLGLCRNIWTKTFFWPGRTLKCDISGWAESITHEKPKTCIEVDRRGW